MNGKGKKLLETVHISSRSSATMLMPPPILSKETPPPQEEEVSERMTEQGVVVLNDEVVCYKSLLPKPLPMLVRESSPGEAILHRKEELEEAREESMKPSADTFPAFPPADNTHCRPRTASEETEMKRERGEDSKNTTIASLPSCRIRSCAKTVFSRTDATTDFAFAINPGQLSDNWSLRICLSIAPYSKNATFRRTRGCKLWFGFRG